MKLCPIMTLRSSEHPEVWCRGSECALWVAATQWQGRCSFADDAVMMDDSSSDTDEHLGGDESSDDQPQEFL